MVGLHYRNSRVDFRSWLRMLYCTPALIVRINELDKSAAENNEAFSGHGVCKKIGNILLPYPVDTMEQKAI